VNLIGTWHVLEAAMEQPGLVRLVDFSTSEVFGSYAYKSEEHDSTTLGRVGEGRWTYAVSKLAAEHMGHAYHREHGLPVVSVRPFNVYGPGQVGEGALQIFVRRAIANEPITIHGDGDQIRSWCYVDDLVEGVLLCLENPAAVGNVFNIGNPRGTITIYGLAETVVRVTGSRSPILFEPKTYADVELRIPSVEKAKQVLGYRPTVDLDEGIRRTAEWYRRAHRSAPSRPDWGRDEARPSRGLRRRPRAGSPRARLRGEARFAPGRAPRGGGEQRHGGPPPRAGGAGRGPRGRGDRAGVHVPGHGERGGLARGAAGVL
jgi:nucleoside-diphosphate-sugar epimerase